MVTSVRLFSQSSEGRTPKFVTLCWNHCVRRAVLPLEDLSRNLLWLLPAFMTDGILCFAPTSLRSLPCGITLSNLPLPPSYKTCGIALKGPLRIQVKCPHLKICNFITSVKSFFFNHGRIILQILGVKMWISLKSFVSLLQLISPLTSTESLSSTSSTVRASEQAPLSSPTAIITVQPSSFLAWNKVS